VSTPCSSLHLGGCPAGEARGSGRSPEVFRRNGDEDQDDGDTRDTP